MSIFCLFGHDWDRRWFYSVHGERWAGIARETRYCKRDGCHAKQVKERPGTFTDWLGTYL